MRPTILAAALLTLMGAGLGPAVLPAAHAGPKPASRAAALARALETQRLQNATFEAVSLPDLLKWLRIATGRNFVLDRRALAKAGIDPAEVTFSAQLEDVTPATILALALEPHGLACVVRDNVVVVTTRAASLGRPVTRIYSISHITYTKVDFIAPDINLTPSGFTPLEDYEPERIVEDDPLQSGDAVAELVREIVAPGEWDNEGWSLRATDRHLFVRAPRGVQVQVARALDVIAALK